ncbi:MAG: LytTR family DNA-binding domain-containing protein [Saprospiraceae bacterium]|nr:LytTR family DNA-binding domain-containing protein [Saprospiraceae bacterium]
MKAILIDDEKSALQSLKMDLEEYCPEVEVVALCQSPAEGIRAISDHQPDMVFLDIEMPKMNGFELLQSLPSIAFDVIFVTAYDQFAVRAFEFNAVDYLLKPILRAQLIQAVQKVTDRQQHHFAQAELDALINNIQLQSHHTITNIALPCSDGYEFVPVNEITHLEGESNYTWVHIQSRKKYLVAKTMKEMSSMIPFPQFFRAHKSHIVNLNHVAKYVRGRGGYLVLRDGGGHIPVSRSQKDELMRVLNV